MTLPLFNPACPDAQPDYAGQPVLTPFRDGGCGQCRAIPKHWRFDVHQVITGVPGVDELEANLMGTHVLTRRLPSLTVGPSPLFETKCNFLSRPVDTTAFYTHEEGAAPGDVQIFVPLVGISLWRLSFPGDGIWWLQAGAFWWHNAPCIESSAAGGRRAFTGVDVGTYAAVRYCSASHFRCRNPNVFTRYDGLFQSSFPDTITIRPFWP